MLKGQLVAIVCVVAIVGGGGYLVWRSHTHSTAAANPSGVSTHAIEAPVAGGADAEDARKFCVSLINAMAAVCVRCTPSTSDVRACDLDNKAIRQCDRALRVRDSNNASKCVTDMSSMSCSDFQRERLPQSCFDQVVFAGTNDGTSDANVEQRTDTPYRKCVRETIESRLDEMKRGIGKPDLKAVESAAIFSCEVAMECHGETECNQKASSQQKKEKEVLDRWR